MPRRRLRAPAGTIVLTVLASFTLAPAQTSTDLFLHGIGPNNNPPTLVLDATAPTASTAKFRDSTGVNFSGGNPWKDVGAWPAAASLTAGTLTALSDLHAWLGLKNSDDQGTQFDLRAEVLKNGTVIATGLTRCITGITRNAANAKEATVAFGSVPATPFNGTSDTLSIKISTRIGTNPDDTKCPGHNNAVGLRLYFDAVSRNARFDATFITQQTPTITSFTPTEGPVGTAVTITGTNFDPVPANNSVTFNGVTAIVTAATATSLTATVPAGAATGPIAVTTAAGTATSADPFTVLAPPVLSPIGDQTVPLGTTLTFTVTATDPNHDPVTFSITPLPLPAHATFQAQTGLFTFTPNATQVGTLPLTVQASDGLFTVSEAIMITVTGAPPGGITSLTGRIDDTAQHPLANVTVTLKGTALSTTTDAQGVFTLTGIAGTQTGRQVLLADGRTAGNFAVLAAPVDVIPNVTTVLPQPLTIPPLDISTAVTVNPAATTVLTSAATGVTVTIAPNSATNPDGTPYTGQLTLSPVPEYGRPESRPVELKPGLSVTIQPAGVVFTPPATITFPNVDQMAAGNELDLWSLSPDTGTFEVKGRMQVSADGQRLNTMSGGVQRSAWHFALAPAASVPNDQNRITGGCTQCAISSNGDLTEGTLTQDITIPGIRTLGVSRDLTLHYTSTTADVRPILPVTATLDVRAAVPQTFSADLTVGGLQQGTRGYWDASVMNENATSTTRLGVQYDAAALPTGRYPYTLILNSHYPQSSIGAITRGFTLLRNERQHPIGAGWTLAGVDRIVLSAGTALLAAGDGRTIPFVTAGLTNLVSWWPAEGTAQDSVSAHHGTLVGGVAFVTGQTGQAFGFDGVNDVIRVPHAPALDPGAGSFTLDAWVNTTVTTDYHVIVSKHECAQFCVGTSRYFFGLNFGKVDAIIREAGASAANPPQGQELTGSRIVTDGQWYHVAMVRDMAARELRLYVDGQLDAAAPLTVDADGTLGEEDGEPDPLLIGAIMDFGGTTPVNLFAGLIDEVEYYNRVVPADELNALFTAGGRRAPQTEFLPPPGEYSTLTRNPDGTFQRRLKDGTTYQFNAQGYQTSMADRNGNTTTYAYNGSNQLTTITDPANQVTTFAYDPQGTLATITDPAGRVTTLTHDSAGNLIAVEAPDQTRMSFNYDAQHHLIQKRDANSQLSAYQFDHAGRLKKAMLPNGDSREIRPTELVSVPDLAAGQGTPGNPTPLSQPPVIQATFKDAKGQTTTFETDAIGRVTKQIDPLNRTTLIDRDPQGNPIRITRPNGAVTTMSYDAKGNLLTSTEPAIAATTTFTYEPTFNQVTSIKDPLNHTTTISYDAKGNPLTITDADNNVTTFTYDSQGLLLTSKDALNQTTTFTYDALGRLLTTTDPLNRTTTLTYDPAGNVATSTDALNRVTTFTYDAFNRLKTVTDPAGGVTTYTYDGNGNLLTVKDAKNQTTTFAYDSRNRLVSTTDPLGKVETYTYDGNDNLLTRITPKSDTISFEYNAVNELIKKTLPGNLVTSYTYDPVGNLLTVTDPDSALAMTYDQANRLLTTSTAGSPNQPAVTFTYTYDKNGNRLTLADGTSTQTYVYDVLNRLASLTSPAGSFGLAYDALSRRTSLTLPNGTQTTYSYDPASQVTNILHKIVSTSTQINKADYVYNGVGNRTSLTDRRGAQTFGYDNLDRLTSASHPLLATPQAFAYDPVGNRTTAGNVTNAGNQLTADATHSYQYDDNGNLTRKTLLATGNFTQYTYDVENRLIQVQDFVAGNPTPIATNAYRYDGLGRRIQKTLSTQSSALSTSYVYDGEDILLEYDGTNVLLARYTHGPGIDEPIAVTKGANTFFYHQDGLGSVTDLTDSTGAMAKSYSYDAYGTILEQPGTVEQPYTYTGREFDAESGLYYYRARNYDSVVGRFLQRDPLRTEVRKGRNLYPYVRNNPLRFTDPSGMQGIEDCKYYDDQCKKSQLPCMSLDSYACKAGDCCRDFGDNDRVNCIRSCLINIDHVCTKLPEPARTRCREIAHAYCYPLCGAIEKDFPPPASCNQLPLFGGLLFPLIGGADRKGRRRGVYLMILLLIGGMYFGLSRLNDLLLAWIEQLGSSPMDLANPLALFRSLLSLFTSLLYLPVSFWFLLWIGSRDRNLPESEQGSLHSISFSAGVLILSACLVRLFVFPFPMKGLELELYHIGYGVGWCFLLAGVLGLPATKTVSIRLRLGLVTCLLSVIWWLTDFVPLHPEVGSMAWALGYVLSFIPALMAMFHCRDVSDRRFAYAGLVLLTLYMVLGRPRWLSSGTLLDFRFMTPLFFLIITSWSVILARSTSVLRKLNVETN